MKQVPPYRIGVTTHDDGTYGVILQIGGFTEADAHAAAKDLEERLMNKYDSVQLKAKGLGAMTKMTTFFWGPYWPGLGGPDYALVEYGFEEWPSFCSWIIPLDIEALTAQSR